MIAALAPGTPCFLANLTGEFVPLTGRVVEVLGPYPTPADDADQWYMAQAEWVRDMFQGRDPIAARRHLKPIVPPAPVATKRKTQMMPTT
jgi:hypothetical protein